MNNALDIQLTNEQLEMLHQFEDVMLSIVNELAEIFKRIYEAIKETVINIWERLHELLDKDVLIVKRKRKGNRYIVTFVKKKLYKILKRVKI